MYWLVQDRLHHEEGFFDLIKTFERFDIPYEMVKVVPFSENAPEDEQLVPNPKLTGNVMVCGSLTMARIAERREWVPGSFHNDNHDFTVWSKHYGENVLNSDSVVCRFADADPTCDPVLYSSYSRHKNLQRRHEVSR